MFRLVPSAAFPTASRWRPRLAPVRAAAAGLLAVAMSFAPARAAWNATAGSARWNW